MASAGGLCGFRRNDTEPERLHIFVGCFLFWLRYVRANEAVSLTDSADVSSAWASDLAVARQAFVKRGLENTAIGLPLYYAGQLIIASNVI